MTRSASITAEAFFVGISAPSFSAALATWILVLESIINAYSDASARAYTGGKYIPEGWS